LQEVYLYRVPFHLFIDVVYGLFLSSDFHLKFIQYVIILGLCFSFIEIIHPSISFRNEPLLVIFSSLLDQLIINASAAQILGADVEIDPYTTP